MANFGEILSSLSIGAGQSVRRNAGNTAFEAYTPSTGGMTIGDAVSGGGANRILYEDGSQNLATDADFTFDGTSLALGSTNAGGDYLKFAPGSGFAASAEKSILWDGAKIAGTYSNFAAGGWGIGLRFYTGNDYSTPAIEISHNKVATFNAAPVMSSGLTVSNSAYPILALEKPGATGNGDYLFVGGAEGTFGKYITFRGTYENPAARIGDINNGLGRHDLKFWTYPQGGGAMNTTPNLILLGDLTNEFAGKITVTSVTEQLRLGYDGSNYWTSTVASNGAVTFDAVGSGAAFTFSDAISFPLGGAISGGGANRVLYEDGSQNLAASASFTFDSNTFVAGGLRVSTADYGGYTTIMGKAAYDAFGANAHAILVNNTSGDVSFNTVAGGNLRFQVGNTGTKFELTGAGAYAGLGRASVSTLQLSLQPYQASDIGLALYKNNSQTGSMIDIRDLSNATNWVVRPDGSTGINTGTSPSAFLHVIGTTEQMRLGYDASNYFKTTVGSTGGVTFDAVGSGAGFTFSDDVTLADAKNIILNTTTGTKIGTGTTQKLGFFNATPVVQRTDSGALTDSTGGSVTGTIGAVSATYDEAEHNANYASLTAKINALRTALRDLGLMA